MNASAPQALVIGQPYAGGFFAGLVRDEAGRVHALIVAPKSEGEHDPAVWIDEYKPVPGAKSYHDGLANTNAMSAAGSALARWARSLRIGGFDDWYLPSQDELEICYRNVKPTGDKNSCWGRSGINLSAGTPTYPYTPDHPLQTSALAFQADGAEAFDDDWYWTSTQPADTADCAWCQTFTNGDQTYNLTDDQLRARAVRRSVI